MPVAWRIVKQRHSREAFDGEGAAKYGGRWNSHGVAVVYTSSTLSLAALETLVHLTPPVTLKYVFFRIEFEDSLVERVRLASLPPEWNAEPPGSSSMAIGDRWAWEARTAILRVPSVLIPGECNYLLNPSHTDFKKIRLGKPEPFALDPRLLPKRR